ncbi:MAG: hypothetical protein WBX16_21680 [Candidatus Acidiferrales bacterium]
MTDQSEVRSLGKRRRTALRVFFGFVVAAIAAFTLGARASDSRGVLTAIGILLAGGALWSFLRFLRAADAHQKLINHEATSFAFVASLLLTLVVGLLQRFGFLSSVSLLVPALMIAFWSIGLILASWRYQ